ncbi:MAG: Ig-like domain-containing protein [bacterium]
MRYSSTVVRSYHVATALAACVGLSACSLNTASDTSLPGGTATLLTLVTGGLQTGTAGASLANPLLFKVIDQFGLAVKGATVTVAPNAASGSVDATPYVTDDTGYVKVTWTLGTTMGTDSLVASVSGLTAVTVLAIAQPGAPANLNVVSGSAQTAAAGSTLNAPLVVKVTDKYGNPVPNALVQWSTDGTGVFASSTEVTDAFGLAINTFTLAPTPGTNNVSAMVTVNTTVLVTTLIALGS